MAALRSPCASFRKRQHRESSALPPASLRYLFEKDTAWSCASTANHSSFAFTRTVFSVCKKSGNLLDMLPESRKNTVKTKK